MKDFRAYILGLCSKKEGYVVEFKGAKGGFPGSFWDTYSSFANTAGGIIVLGITEKDNVFKMDGLTEDQIHKYKKIFWDNSHDARKVSYCLCQEDDVLVEEDNGAWYLIFKIPRATFDIKPVYLNGDPFHGNTFRRNHEGDYHCSDNEVRLMMADSIILQNPQDSRTFKGIKFEDLDETSIRQYRQVFSDRNVGHAWNSLSDKAFLKKLGGYSIDSETGEEAVTLAGVLMFGQDMALTTALPYYFVDYREKLSANPNIRWTDRVCPDGRWQPNLFQFYSRIYPKLSQALPVPFKLDETGFNRIDDTPAHKSLRESIVNTLCHCRWGMMEGIVIERYPDRLYFSDPGVMLISIDEFYEGGHSICRNPALQTMFRLIGTGDKAGSGADVIKTGWNENGWPDPELKEHFGAYSDRVELTLRLGAVSGQNGKSEEKSDKKGDKKSVKKTKDRIKDMMRENEYVTLSQMAEALDISVSGVAKSITRMQNHGEIVRHGADNGGYWEVLK